MNYKGHQQILSVGAGTIKYPPLINGTWFFWHVLEVSIIRIGIDMAIFYCSLLKKNILVSKHVYTYRQCLSSPLYSFFHIFYENGSYNRELIIPILLQKLKLLQGKRIKYFLFDNVLSIYNFFYMFWKFNRKKLGNWFLQHFLEHPLQFTLNIIWTIQNPRGLYFSPFTWSLL